MMIGMALVTVVAGYAASADNEAQSRVQEKAQQVQIRTPKWVQEGGDSRRLDLLGNQVEQAIKAGKQPDAEAALDKILAIVGGPYRSLDQTRALRALAQAKPFA